MLFAVFAGIFPRLGLFIIWVARPERVDAAFDSFIWPLLGLILLPFATLIYVILWQVGGLSGWDWFCVGHYPVSRSRSHAMSADWPSTPPGVSTTTGAAASRTTSARSAPSM